ncbi:DMT family transporter [Caedibacter taeniospiralis]|uniref:DMT family transporter n=1 Tax=Caedibacter taeniospiralis TaxID=28907 RepID=UPI000C275894|nr:DMT family transporter [Caedibacter taeniospiralis]
MNYLLLLIIGLIWGGQFILIDLSLSTYTPEQLSFLRTFYAAVFLIIFCLITRRKYAKRDLLSWLKVIIIGLLEVVIPFVLIMWGQQFVSGSMASILMGTIPFFTIVLMLLTGVERATGVKFLSVLVGFAGLIVLFLPDLRNGLSMSYMPQIAILMGALSFALALIVIRSLPQEDSFVLSRDAFIVGSIVMCVINSSNGSLSNIHFSISPFLASLSLGVFCSGLVYVLYVSLIKRAGAGFCSLSNYLVPLFGSLFGVIIMGDHISINMIFACVLILSSIAIEPILRYVKRRKVSILSGRV